MSRGPGHLQRRLLELFDDPDTAGTALFLAAVVYDIKPNSDGMRLVTDAQLSAVRRALMALYRGRKVSRFHCRDGKMRWAPGDGTTVGETGRALARKIGVSASTISRVRRELCAQELAEKLLTQYEAGRRDAPS